MNTKMPPENNTPLISAVSTELTDITDNEAEITVRKIGGTTYIVTSEYNENAKEGLLDKIWRLIQNDTN